MKFKHVLGILFAGVFILLVIVTGDSKRAEAADTRVPVRIGWQIPAAMQAQIVEVLKRTDVLESQGLVPNFVPFSYADHRSRPPARVNWMLSSPAINRRST